jgi:hypothetical protein
MLKKLLSLTGILALLVTAAPALADGDTEAPVVTGISAPSSVAASVPVSITATYTDNLAVINCNLQVNGGLIGPMQVAGSAVGTASISYAFGGGSDYYYVTVECLDAAGNVGNKTIQVAVADNTGTGTPPTGYQDRLVKLRCPAGAVDVNNPCKAVYYVGADNKRHAFPNEKVFFTWYTNFGGVVELSGSELAAFTLGRNVTSKPYKHMVKFPTDPKVYSVDVHHTLRWVTTPAIAEAIYGSDWKANIDDVSDTFHSDYLFGADLLSANGWDMQAAALSQIGAEVQ